MAADLIEQLECDLEDEVTKDCAVKILQEIRTTYEHA
jgi:hypothetical protein